MLTSSDEDFALNYAKVHPEEFQAFLRSRNQTFGCTGGEIESFN